jgi:hypothetical protein
METKGRCRNRRLLLPAVALATAVLFPTHRLHAQGVFVSSGAEKAESAEQGRSGPGMELGSCLLKGRPVHDFKLRNIVTGGMTTFLETVRRDYTFLYYLNAGSRDSLENLNTLERLRDRHRDRIGLVAIFLDRASESDILRFLIFHQIYPDYALHDPASHQAGCYGFTRAPVLHVVGPGGGIIFTVAVTRPVDLAAFTARLDHVLGMNEIRGSDFTEARHVYIDAMSWLAKGRHRMALFYLERVLELQPNLYTVNCQMADIYRELNMRKEAARHYARYLGAGRPAYDLDQVKSSLRSLATLPSP